MSKLREKLLHEIFICDDILASEQCEQIADDFTKKCLDWCLALPKYKLKSSSTTELLQIFKDKFYE